MNTKLNKSDWIVICIVYLVSLSFNAYDYFKKDNMLKEYIIDFSSHIIFSLAIVLIFLNWLIPNFLIKKRKFFLFTLFGLLFLFIGGATDYIIGFWSGENDWNKFPKFLNLILRTTFRLSDLVGIILGILLTKKFYESQNQIIKIEKQQKENELKLLRSQLDPHFLFNNLNTLDALIDSNPNKAKEYINRLSLIYRYLIQTKDSEVMELSAEINFTENYIFLLKTRFGDDYKFIINKNNTLQNKYIPTGAVQTLLENVVKHNKTLNKKSILTEISIENNELIIKNEKGIQPISKNSLKTGLKNLKSRYKLLTDKEILILNTEEFFTVKIPIINLDN